MSVVMMMIVMPYDKNRDDDDDDDSDIGGMNDMIFRSTNIYNNQHHDISLFLHLYDEIMMVSYDGDMMIMIITMIHMIIF
jgi:hypothetical protein